MFFLISGGSGRSSLYVESVVLLEGARRANDQAEPLNRIKISAYNGMYHVCSHVHQSQSHDQAGQQRGKYT